MTLWPTNCYCIVYIVSTLFPLFEFYNLINLKLWINMMSYVYLVKCNIVILFFSFNLLTTVFFLVVLNYYNYLIVIKLLYFIVLHFVFVNTPILHQSINSCLIWKFQNFGPILYFLKQFLNSYSGNFFFLVSVLFL